MFSEREAERERLHVTFIAAYGRNFLVVMVVHLLLCLFYKLNFLIGLYVQGKNSTCWAWCCLQCQASAGGVPAGMGGGGTEPSGLALRRL